MGHVNEQEIDWLIEHDIKVAHCPTASMFLGLGNLATGMFPKMIEGRCPQCRWAPTRRARPGISTW